ncbi:STAS domain-containing protein [Amycolatopsis antarctica]|uniref:STAS domain-containing protein n=1 Tax=Amycolatopsis antarctica TaxID=1854586 RepID=UPI001F0AC809|nr:STAS domain-containing protein [Amycolatopsis antarctica]
MTTDDTAVRDLLVRVLTDRRAELAQHWVDLQFDRDAHSGAHAERELRAEADDVLRALAEGLHTGLPAEEVVHRHGPLRDTITELSVRRARTGAAPTTTALATLALKEVILEAVQRETTDPPTLFATSMTVNRLLDAAGTLTFHSYVEGREEIIRQQHQQMLELSTPVIRLWQRVLAVPLIGTLDSARSQVVMNGLLEAIQANEARVAIIDITGVPTVDTVVAQHLLQTASAVRLMGADCLISGIRPAIAQTITQLGIDLSAITTRSTLADALAESLRRLDAEDTASGRGAAS